MGAGQALLFLSVAHRVCEGDSRASPLYRIQSPLKVPEHPSTAPNLALLRSGPRSWPPTLKPALRIFPGPPR